VPLILEKSEYPFVYSPRTKPWQTAYRDLHQRFVYRLFDGAIVISTMLQDYFSQHLRAGAPILRVPILVDTRIFPPPDSEPSDCVLYLGTLSHSGEVESLIVAFSSIAGTHPGTTLVIGGAASAADEARVLACAQQSGVAKRVRILGQVAGDDVPALVTSARVLALPRSSGTFSSAGFPTKLGEYLAAGRPVVVTATGDIPLYLTNSVDALLVPPDDSAAFASALGAALDDPSAGNLGRAGRETATREFNPATHMRAFLSLVESLTQGMGQR
jgi:glycosyltransferase involved in cell wall biosynthesis